MKLNEGERIDDIGFGELRLIQRPKEFCYGIDAVILADFAARGGYRGRERFYGKNSSIADLGTGTGVVPIILSHKTDCGAIFGIEKQEIAYEAACRNIAMNDLSSRLKVVCRGVEDKDLPAVIKDMARSGGLDAVTCNPPYVTAGCGMANHNDAKYIARHETTGTLEDFIAFAGEALKQNGDFYMVHRPSRIVDILCLCRDYKLEPKALRFVFPNKKNAPNILLLHCIKGAGRELKFMDPLYVYEDDGNYSEEIKKIYERR